MLEPLLAAVGATVFLLLGSMIGWLAGKRQGQRELELFRAGLAESHRGGPCWLRTQLPPHDP